MVYIYSYFCVKFHYVLTILYGTQMYRKKRFQKFEVCNKDVSYASYVIFD